MRRQHCYFCTNYQKEVDYKDEENLRKFISPYGKIYGRRKTHLCAKHQRKVSSAVKRARSLALISLDKK